MAPVADPSLAHLQLAVKLAFDGDYAGWQRLAVKEVTAKIVNDLQS